MPYQTRIRPHYRKCKGKKKGTRIRGYLRKHSKRPRKKRR